MLLKPRSHEQLSRENSTEIFPQHIPAAILVPSLVTRSTVSFWEISAEKRQNKKIMQT